MSYTKRTEEEARATLDTRMNILRSQKRLPNEPLVILSVFSRVRSEGSAFHIRMMWLAFTHNRERVPGSGAAVYYRENGVPPIAERDDGVVMATFNDTPAEAAPDDRRPVLVMNDQGGDPHVGDSAPPRDRHESHGVRIPPGNGCTV